MRRLALLTFMCSVSCKDDYRPLPSVLSVPRTEDWAHVAYPFRCNRMNNGMLVVDFKDRIDAVSRVDFEWIEPWNETIGPRASSPIDEMGILKKKSVSIPDDYTLTSLIFEEAPARTRVVARVHAKANQGFWKMTSRSCWTGRGVRVPGPVHAIQVKSVTDQAGHTKESSSGKVEATIWLPSSPNGPVDGLMLRWCPMSKPNCRPEDVLFAKQPANVEFNFTAILEPEEDEETEAHTLCVAAYNLRERERRIGKLTCAP